MYSRHRGFTLIETLITFTIMIILAGISIYIFRQFSLSGRDTRRKQDLATVAGALELYYQKNKVYPGTAGSWYCSYNTSPCSSSSDPWIPSLVPDFINDLPDDPTQGSRNDYIYLSLSNSFTDSTIPYCSNISSGQFYILGAPLESNSDNDSLSSKDVKDCIGVSLATYSPFNNGQNWYVLVTK